MLSGLAIINPKSIFKKDIDKIKEISGKIDNRLSKLSGSDKRIQKLTLDELQDVSKIVSLADFMLQKYEDKKDTKTILEEFVLMIRESAESIEGIDDEISELILSAEDSIKKIKEVHSKIHAKSGLETIADSKHVDQILAETGSINLTKFATEINAVEYQQNSQEDSDR